MPKAKRLRDPNQLARMIVDIATGEAENTPPARPYTRRKANGRAEGREGEG